MDASILGLHHVTATAAGAQQDLDFYAGVLGLRLVKKTVNFDNRGVYHFYYGDERGSPGTLWTTFPYAGQGVARGTKGAGQITVTSFSVPRGSLEAWRRRLDGLGLRYRDAPERLGAPELLVEDASSLVAALVESDDGREPWRGGGVPEDMAIRGVHGVTLTVRDPGPTLEFLAGFLGHRMVAEEGSRTRMAAGAELPGHFLEVVGDREAPAAVNGIGTVHHVAMAVAGDEEQLAFRHRLLEAGHYVTEVRDRQYFRSIYFREPGGVLYEIATVGPGFTVDEEVADLGSGLRLAPWDEPARSVIEAALPEVVVPAPVER